MAAARLVTPILVKMLLRWRATVFWLTTSSAAINLFVAPVATNRSTSTRPSAVGPDHPGSYTGDGRDGASRSVGAVTAVTSAGSVAGMTVGVPAGLRSVP